MGSRQDSGRTQELHLRFGPQYFWRGGANPKPILCRWIHQRYPFSHTGLDLLTSVPLQETGVVSSSKRSSTTISARSEANCTAIHVIQTCRYSPRCSTHLRSVTNYLSCLNVPKLRVLKIEKSYLVFVAIKNIREGEELTIDYHPNLAIPKKGKGKRKRRESDTCMCDAKMCRGVRP